MNYEEKYKEALERVRRLHDRMLVLSSTDALVASAELEFIFPELRESEDERIRKSLVQTLQLAKRNDGKLVISNTLADKYLAYLEKQKEKSEIPINASVCSEKPNDHSERDDFESRLMDCMCAAQQYRTGTISWDVVKGWAEELNELKKPVEWSEEDEEMLEYVIGDLNDAKQLFHAKDAIDLCDKEIAWLKSLRPQPKQEWTEEEKQKLNRIYSIIGWAMDEHAFSSCKKLIGDKEGVELQDFLRSIAKPEQQPSWKPSEEQMKALNALNCHGDLSYLGQQNQLISLYNDLKKLM